MRKTVDELVDRELLGSLTKCLGRRGGKLRPASELYRLAMSSNDERVIRTVALFLWKSGLEWPDFSFKVLSLVADEQKRDAVMLAMLANSQSIGERELFEELLVGSSWNNFLEAMIAYSAVKEKVGEYAQKRMCVMASELLKDVSVLEDKNLLKYFAEEGVCDASDALKAWCGKKKSFSERSKVVKVLEYFGIKYEWQCVWGVMNGTKCTEQVAKWLGYKNLAWTDEERSVWSKYCKQGVWCVLNTENLRWCLSEGYEGACRVPLDSERSLGVLEEYSSAGLVVLKNSLKYGSVYKETVESFPELFSLAFQEWDEELTRAYEELQDVVRVSPEFRFNWLAEQGAVEDSEEFRQWVFKERADDYEELTGQECPRLLEADEYGVDRQIVWRVDGIALQEVDEDWCKELQYWVLKHPESEEWIEESSVWELNRIFKELGYWDGDVDFEWLASWSGGYVGAAVGIAWGKEYAEKVEELEYRVRFRDLPGKFVLDGDWFINWCKARGRLDLKDWSLVKSTNGEVPEKDLDEWRGVEAPGYWSLGAKFWQEFNGEEWLLGLPEDFLQWVKEYPEFLWVLKGREVPEECVLLERAFYTQCDFESFRELPDCLLKEGTAVVGVVYNANNLDLLEKPGRLQQAVWHCGGKLPSKIEENWEAVKDPAILGFNLASLEYEAWFSGRNLTDEQKVRMMSYPYYWDSESIPEWKSVIELGLRKPISESGYDILNKEGFYWIAKEDCRNCSDRIFQLWKSGELGRVKELRYYGGEQVRDAFRAWVKRPGVLGLPKRFGAGKGEAFGLAEAMELAKKLPVENYWLMVLNLLDETWELDGEKLFRWYPTEGDPVRVLEYDFGGGLRVYEEQECWVGVTGAPGQIHFEGSETRVFSRPELVVI